MAYVVLYMMVFVHLALVLFISIAWLLTGHTGLTAYLRKRKQERNEGIRPKPRTIIVAGEEVPCCVGEVFDRDCDDDCTCLECGRKRFPKARVVQDPAVIESCRRNFS